VKFAGREKIALILTISAHAAILSIFGLYRIVGNDEGYYLNAARLVGMGKSLYADFFFPQLTLLPTLFSKLATNGWTSFWILRAAAIVFGIGSAILLFAIALKISRNSGSALIALFLYCFSGMILSMHTIFEPFVFTQFFALTTFLTWMSYNEKRSPMILAAIGISLSTLINLRAVYLILLPLYSWSILELNKNNKIRAAAIFGLAMIPPALPTIYGLIKSADRLIYDAFLFQIARDANRDIGSILANKIMTMGKTIVDPHLLTIFALAAISSVALRKQGKLAIGRNLATTPTGMAALNLILIAGVYLTPHPILRHYVEQFLPFAVILLAANINFFLDRLRRIFKPIGLRLILGAWAAVYLLSLVPYIAVYIFAHRGTDRRFLIAEIRKMTEQLTSPKYPGDTVLSEWAGYYFFAGVAPLPRTEVIGSHWPLPLTHEEYGRYNLCDSVYLKEKIARRTPSHAIIINNPPSYYAEELNKGYHKTYQSGAVSLYCRK
jgi:hypothetical protein